MGTTSEGRGSRRFTAFATGVLATVLAAMLLAVPGASAAELVYWDNYSGSPDSVAFANLDGSGGGALNLAGAEKFEDPEGMAYDPVTNRLYVPNEPGPGNGRITYINLDGSGAGLFTVPGVPMVAPEGVAIAPSTRTIYWTNETDEISWARLDGSAGGVLNTTGATLEDAYRLAIDPAGGKLYWGSNLSGSKAAVSFARLDNSGGGDLDISGANPPANINGIAVDPAAGRVYWVGSLASELGFASLSGGNGGNVDTTGAPFNGPYGLALDPSLGRAYWANYSNGPLATGAIGFAAVSGGGGGGIDIATAPVGGPQDPVILKSPATLVQPKLYRPRVHGKRSRTRLACTLGSWAGDYPGSFVYQSPRSYSYKWKRNGKTIGGGKATHKAKTPGKYKCIVTATNQAGSASKASKPFKVKKPKKHRKRR